MGDWSDPVDGLRGRIVTSGARPDGTSLRVDVELENVGTDPLAIHWDGRPELGYATFRLDDESGDEVPEPEWRLGGNEPGGALAMVVATSERMRQSAGEVIARFDGGRILRIGAFWAREMPSDGARRFLGAELSGRAAAPDDLAVGVSEEETTVGRGSATDARTWRGPLRLPAVCVN